MHIVLLTHASPSPELSSVKTSALIYNGNDSTVMAKLSRFFYKTGKTPSYKLSTKRELILWWVHYFHIFPRLQYQIGRFSYSSSSEALTYREQHTYFAHRFFTAKWLFAKHFKMGLLSPRISLKIFTTISLLILFKSRCCHAHAASKSSGNMTAGEKLRATELLSQQKWHVEQIHLFLVTLPCLLLFSFVFACYVCIWKTQRLHGWIVLAITGSLALRFGVIFHMDLPKFYFHYKPFLCVTYGEYRSCF